MAANIRPLLTFKHVQSLFTATTTTHNYNSNTLFSQTCSLFYFTYDAPKKMFCPITLPPGSPGARGKMCVIKKGGALENEGIKVINKGGVR